MVDYRRWYPRWRASGRFPEFVRRDALHEAAHAIIGEALGSPVVFVTLSGRPESERSVPYTSSLYPGGPRRHERRAIVALAGHAADGRDWRHAGECGDCADARKAAGYVTGSDLDHLWAIARRLVKWNRPAIERLAAALLAEETITGDRVRARMGG